MAVLSISRMGQEATQRVFPKFARQDVVFVLFTTCGVLNLRHFWVVFLGMTDEWSCLGDRGRRFGKLFMRTNHVTDHEDYLMVGRPEPS